MALYPGAVTLAILGRAARLTAVLAGAVACLLALASEADAAWLPPVPASESSATVSEPQIAVDAAGNATVVWTSGTAPSRSIRSAFRPAGGSWEPSFTRITSTFDCHAPRLAVNSSGAAALVAECEKPSAAIRAAYRPSTSWNGALEIAGSSEGNAPRAAIAPNGDVDAVWSGPGSTVVASHRPAGGSWSSGSPISPAGTAVEPNLAVSPGGYAFAVWHEGADETKYSRRSPGTSGTWTMPIKLNALGSVAVGEPQIAVGISGQRMMAWSQQGSKQLMAERTSSGDLFGINEPARSISEAGGNVEDPQIAVDGTGLGVAAWRSDEGGAFPIKAAATSFINGGWSAPQTLSGPTSVGVEPTVAADPAGDATVVWSFGSSVNAASRPAGGSFGPTTVISNASHTGFERPLVEITAAGDALVVWPASANHVAIAVNDVSPPTISAIAVPATVETGSAATMSATPTDTWSAASLAWDFGDGAHATGPTVSHAYASAGTKTVTITAADGAGNTAVATAPITVTTPGGGAGGGGAGGTAGTGGAGGTGGPEPTARHRIVVTATAVAQPWVKQAKAKALQVKCKLDVKGTCTAIATVTKAVAKKLGLAVPKGGKPVRIGRGSAAATAGRFAVVKVRLNAKALIAIAASPQPVPVAFVLEGTAAGNDPGAAASRLTLHP